MRNLLLLGAVCAGALLSASFSTASEFRRPGEQPRRDVPEQTGRMKWRFRVPAAHTAFHPAVGPDGTIYLNDVHGQTYALNPDGTLQWAVSGRADRRGWPGLR